MLAGRANRIPELYELDPLIQPSYAAVASPEAFEAQIELLTRISTRHESIMALYELVDVWNYVAGVVRAAADGPQYRKRDVLLATSVSPSLNARTILSPDRSVQIILFYERLFPFVEHVAYLLPLAVREDQLDDDWQATFPTLVNSEITCSFTPEDAFEKSVRLLLERYLEGELRIDRTWSHGFGTYRRLVAQDVASSMLFFVIGHELAHGLCEHKGNLLSWTVEEEPGVTGGPPAKLELSEVERSWEQEREADYVGLSLGLIVASRNAIPSQVYYWSCYLLFRALTWCSLESTTPPIAATDQQRWQRYPTHPPATERLRWLETMAGAMKPSRTSGSDMISFGPIESICDAVERMRLEWYG
jgi:hypothetical protein